jgi:hypothetical protein
VSLRRTEHPPSLFDGIAKLSLKAGQSLDLSLAVMRAEVARTRRQHAYQHVDRPMPQRSSRAWEAFGTRASPKGDVEGERSDVRSEEG